MNPVQKEVMALTIELKRIVSLRLCNEISRKHLNCAANDC